MLLSRASKARDPNATKQKPFGTLLVSAASFCVCCYVPSQLHHAMILLRIAPPFPIMGTTASSMSLVMLGPCRSFFFVAT